MKVSYWNHGKLLYSYGLQLHEKLIEKSFFATNLTLVETSDSRLTLWCRRMPGQPTKHLFAISKFHC